METAKDKAKSLVEKYKKYCSHKEDLNKGFGVIRTIDIYDNEKAIECAKITVDEIFNIYNNQTGSGRMIAVSQDDYKYWYEVKNELKKM